MRKILTLALAGIVAAGSLQAQDSTSAKKKKDWSKVTLGDRPNDHFMVQLGYDGWAGGPDTLNPQGFSRHFNVYFMLDKPFKTDPRLSVGLGAGFGSSHIFFKETNVDIVGRNGGTKAKIANASNTEHFKKTKLGNVWLEAPVELRWVANPLQSSKSFKAALGVKLGTMVSAYTKGKDWETADDKSIYGAKYRMKERSKRFFNNTRLAATARVGFGPVSLYGAYQITSLFKENLGPDVRPYSIGLCFSGL